MNNIFPRGSEWRKWDLHIHTPSSIIQHYGGDNDEVWEKFIKALEHLPNEIKVIGITDYYFIDGYEKVIKFKKQGRLKNIEKIFPILEFRIDTFGSGNENKLQKINLHILFNIDERNLDKEVNKIRKEFIEQIPITRLPQHKTKMLTKENLSAEANNNLKTGFSDLIPHTDTVFELLASETWKNKIFLFLGYKEWSNLEKNNQLKPLKEFLYNKVNAFFSSNFSTFPKSQEWLKEFGNKNLLHSNDIHKFDDLDKTNYSCFTWIKADPTFEGLRQIVYEPEDRVRIQETKPEEKELYQLIDYVKFINNDKKTFTDEKIYLNQNLNVIIGGKSTGKSILLREIVRTIDPKEVKKRLEDVDLDDYEVYKENESLSDDFIVKWVNGEENRREESEENKNKKIIYIPQSYLNRLVDRRGEESPIDNLIENILKTNDEIENIFTNLNNNINQNNKNIDYKINILFEILQKIEEKDKEIKELGNKTGIEKYIETIKQEIKNLQGKAGLKKEDIEDYNDLRKKYDELKQELNKSEQQKRDFQNILNIQKISFNYQFEQFLNTYPNFKENTNQILEKAESDINSFISEKLNYINKHIKELNKNIELKENDLKPFIERTQYKKQLEEKTKILENESKKLNKFLEKEKELEQLNMDKDEVIESLVDYFVEYFHIKNEFKKELKNSLKSDQKSFTNDLKLDIDIRFKNNDFQERFIEDVFDKRSIPKEYEDFNFDLGDIGRLKAVIKDFVVDILENKTKIKSKYIKDKKLVIQNLLKDRFIVKYNITYENDNLSSMSSGKKSFVLLRLIIELDKSKCPLLIDQPEDDLDNRSIYNDVVKFIKDKKKERQIIIVTHNANLAVGTDAECIIVANQDGKKSKNKKFKFEYIQGSLENSFIKPEINEILYKQGIKEHICEILEGGKEAFDNRKKKYNF